MPSLEAVPDEIIRHILYFVSPEDNLANIQLLSRRFHSLANEPLLWKYHNRASFRYWASKHQFARKLTSLASEVEWKLLWLERTRTNRRIARTFDDLLPTKVGRLRKLGHICQLGYDAKDFLLMQLHTEDSVEDHLARW